MNTKTKVIGTIAGASALALSGTGVAFASTGGAATKPASTPAAATATARHAHHRHPLLRAEIRKVLRHTVHAELIVATAKHGYVTVDADKGTLQSDTSNVLTLVRPDGPSVTATITPKTHFYGLSATKLASGDKMVIVQSGGNALIVASKLPS